LKSANSRLQMLLQSRSSLGAPRRAAPILAILVIIITFLILKASLHNTAQTTASISRTAAQENTIPLSADSTGDRETARSNGVAMAGTPEAHVAEQFGKSAPLQVSHMQVTDRATEDAIRTLSRYELAGLRRRAVYGDDSAAFQMGMAYELGHGVRQSCTTAAQWVARAAGDGNAAAQYNLGVRYRDGDGVPVNENEAVKWLQKAAAQESPNAQLALMPLTAHRARFVSSRP
jgi:TPR repeat protein